MVLVNAVVTAFCMSGFLAAVNKLVKKDVCYQYTAKQRSATIRKWEMKEHFVSFSGFLYVIGTSSYVAVFLFMLPSYASSRYVQATLTSLSIVELLKPFLEAGIITLVLKSKYSVSFAAHFPQLCDFSYLHVLTDAEFTHAHWAELSRVLNSESAATNDGAMGTLPAAPQSDPPPGDPAVFRAVIMTLGE